MSAPAVRRLGTRDVRKLSAAAAKRLGLLLLGIKWVVELRMMR